MKQMHQEAAWRLHDFLASADNASEAQLRAELEAEGVNVTAFLHRLQSDEKAPVSLTSPVSKPGLLAGKLKKLAQSTQRRMENFLEEFSPAETNLPAGVLARTGGQASKQDAPKVRKPSRKSR